MPEIKVGVQHGPGVLGVQGDVEEGRVCKNSSVSLLFSDARKGDGMAGHVMTGDVEGGSFSERLRFPPDKRTGELETKLKSLTQSCSDERWTPDGGRGTRVPSYLCSPTIRP